MGLIVSYVLGIQQGTQSLLAQNLPLVAGGATSVDFTSNSWTQI